jgi:hypothetical protein
MNSELDEEFIALFTKLPERVKHTARKNYRLWKEDPGHPGLEFKAVAGVDNVYSVCVGIGWRDLGVLRAEDNTIVWFWIGPHQEYDKLLKML